MFGFERIFIEETHFLTFVFSKLLEGNAVIMKHLSFFPWFKRHVYQFLSLKQVFYIIVLLNSVSILLCALAGYQIYTAAYNQLLSDSLASSLSVTSAQIAQSMENVEYVSTLMLSSSAIQEQLSDAPAGNDVPGMNEYNRTINNALSEYSSLFRSNHIAYAALFGPTATNSTNWALQEKTVPYLLDAAIFNGQKRAGAVTWTSCSRSRYLLLSRNIRQISGLSLQSLGNLVIAVDIESLVSSASQFVSTYPDQKFIFFTPGGSILYAPDDMSDEEAKDLIQTSNDPWQIQSFHGHKYFVIQGTLPHYQYHYLSMAPYDKIANALQKSMRLLVLILAAGMLIVTFLSNRLINAIIHQFDVLIGRMESFSQNELELPKESTPMEYQPREIRSLHHNFNEMARRIQELVQITYTNKLLAKDAQLRALRSQISPHFLYNTLETINWRAKAVGNQKISQIAESLGNLLRASLSNQKPLVTLSYELELVDSFITIQKIRFEEQLEFHSEISEEARSGQIPPLTIQPLVENAIHYGMEEMTEVCHIDLTAEIKEGILNISVKNEGSFFEEELLEKLRSKTRKPNGFGIGLLNIDERIRLIFGDEYGLSLSNEGGLAVATIRLPFRTQEDTDLC